MGRREQGTLQRMPTPPRPSLWRSHPGVLAGLVLLVLGNATLPLLYGLHPVVWFLDYSTALILAFWAAALAWRRARRVGPRAFLLVGLGAALGGLRYVPTMLSLPLANLMGPAISILGLLALGAGFLGWPQRTRMPRDRVRTLLDGLALALSLFMAAWMLLDATDWVGRITREMLLIYLLQISACLGVLALWLLQESRTGLPEQALAKRMVRLALIALLVHSALGAFLRVTGYYHPGYLGHAAEVLHQVANALLALAALSPDAPPSPDGPRNDPSPLRAMIPSVLPLAVLAYTGLHVFQSPAAATGTLLSLGLSLLGVLALRHGLLIRDLEHLSRGLEARVEARTQELEAHHQAALGDLRMRMMAGLAAGLAHDLNNILGIIRLRVDLLEESCTPPQREDLKVLGEASDRAVALTRHILASGRTQVGSPREFDVSAWLQGRQDLLQALLHPGQTLAFQMEPGRVVLADSQSFEQVVENLVTNAREAMGPAGRLTVTVQAGPGLVRISLEDDGCGIPPEHLDRLFEPFFTTKASGTGLGLATVRNLMVQNRGDIRVESCPGQGTTFHLELPAAPGLPC